MNSKEENSEDFCPNYVQEFGPRRREGWLRQGGIGQGGFEGICFIFNYIIIGGKGNDIIGIQMKNMIPYRKWTFGAKKEKKLS